MKPKNHAVCYGLTAGFFFITIIMAIFPGRNFEVGSIMFFSAGVASLLAAQICSSIESLDKDRTQ